MGDRTYEAIHAASRSAGPPAGADISEPFISSWPKAPSQRELSVEAVMDVARTILQPVPCGEQPAEIEDAIRAQQYALLAKLLARTPDPATHLAVAQAADNARADENQIRSAIHGDRDAGIHAARVSGRENHRRTRR
jgi:hypothetical protein